MEAVKSFHFDELSDTLHAKTVQSTWIRAKRFPRRSGS